MLREECVRTDKNVKGPFGSDVDVASRRGASDDEGEY
jgi:hypothetical protein